MRFDVVSVIHTIAVLSTPAVIPTRHPIQYSESKIRWS